MKKAFLLLAVSCLLLAGCASRSFVRQEIEQAETRALVREAKTEDQIMQLCDEVRDTKENTEVALSLANRALWKVKVTSGWR